MTTYRVLVLPHGLPQNWALEFEAKDIKDLAVQIHDYMSDVRPNLNYHLVSISEVKFQISFEDILL